MQLKLIYLQYEEAVKGREVFESNDYLLFAFMSRVMLTFNSRCSSNKIATSFNMWLIKRKNYKYNLVTQFLYATNICSRYVCVNFLSFKR